MMIVCTEGHLPTNPMAVYGSCEGLTHGVRVNPWWCEKMGNFSKYFEKSLSILINFICKLHLFYSV